MRPSNLVPSFYFYKLADALSGPYTALSAYSAGVIDAQGNILKPESSIDAFEYLVIKLKKIIDQLPYGMTKAQLGNYLSSIQYFSEAFEEFEITQEQFHCMMEGFVCQATNNEVSYLELLEDMSVGAGGGAPGSLGTPIANSQGPGVAGYDPKLGMPMQRRKQPKYFDNCEVFEVCPEEFIQFKAAKRWKDIPDSDTKKYVQTFQRRNKNSKIAVKSLNPLNGENEMHWISYPAHNFMEDVEVSLYDLLFEEKESKVGRVNLDKIAAAQYTAVSNFLNNHFGKLHELGDDDDITVHAGGSEPTSVKFRDFGKHVASNISAIHGTEKKQRNDAVFTFTTKNGTVKATVPHVSTHGVPDLKIEDSYVSDSPIEIDTKAGRGRWEDHSGKFQDDNKKPRRVPTSEFDTGKPNKNSFVVIHDSNGEIKYVDYSNLPNVKKLLSKVYVKAGSSRRPGKFAMIGEIGMRLAKEGIKKAFKRHLPFYQEKIDVDDTETILKSSSKENFASKLGELTNTKFGENDLYTSLFRKQRT